MTAALSVLSLTLAIILAVAAAHKLAERTRLAHAAAGLLRVGPALVMPATMAATAIEVAAALALLFPYSHPAGALLAALLWAGYGAALVAARRRGDGGLDCGCDFGSRATGIGRFTIFRAFGLAAAALVICLSPTGGGGIDVQSIFAALAFVALLFAAGEIAHLPATRRSIAR